MSEVKFDKATHTYSLEGKNLISVTQLLQMFHLSPDYTIVDEDTLKASADRGSMIHAEIEAYNKRGEIGFTTEMANYKKYLDQNGLKCLKSEFIVFDDIVAGTADLLLDEHGEKVIADIKTTATLHRNSVSWQLSLYAYLLGDTEVKRGQAFWFDHDGNLKVLDIPLKPKAEVERLLKCAESGESFEELVPVEQAQLSKLEEAEELIKYYDFLKKKAQEQSDEIKKAIMKAMEDNSVYSFENEALKVTYVAPTTRTTIDSARLKKELPEIAEKYTKRSDVKASLRITIKGEQK